MPSRVGTKASDAVADPCNSEYQGASGPASRPEELR